MQNRRERILFLGTNMWPGILSGLLDRYLGGEVFSQGIKLGPKSAHRFLTESLRADVVVRVGFPPGMTTAKAQMFDVTCSVIQRLSSKVRWFCYWIGSDVTSMAEYLQTGQVTTFFSLAKQSRHLAGAPWFVDELGMLGIDAEPCLFPLELPHWTVSTKPARFSVLTYIPDGRAAFYGGMAIYEAARQLPGIDFDVIGGKGTWIPTPLRNLRFHGWRTDVNAFLEHAHVLVRLVPHDAVGGTVREALSAACHVIYTMPLPHTRTIPYGDGAALISELHNLCTQHQSGMLHPNAPGQRYASSEWNTEILVKRLAEKLLAK